MGSQSMLASGTALSAGGVEVLLPLLSDSTGCDLISFLQPHTPLVVFARQGDPLLHVVHSF